MGERVQGKRKYIDKEETAQNTQANEQSMQHAHKHNIQHMAKYVKTTYHIHA